MTEFGALRGDGTYKRYGTVDQADMLICPHKIVAFDHYRPDGSCRCDDPDHTAMKDWGYKWENGAWR